MRLLGMGSRVQVLYRKRFGPDRISIIKDSNTVDVSKLDPAMGYIQITFVKPYFGDHDTSRTNYFELNHDINEFIFETPFTQSGKARGGVEAQCMRKTILTVAGDLSFPYMVRAWMQAFGGRVSVQWVVLHPSGMPLRSG